MCDGPDPRFIHGAFTWCELLTPDLKKASTFYGSLFGWEFRDDPGTGSGPYTVIRNRGEAIGGMMKPPPQAPPQPMWGAYVAVDDVDQIAKKVPVLGGKVLMPPTDIPRVGRIAVIQDPQGAVIHAITWKHEH